MSGDRAPATTTGRRRLRPAAVRRRPDRASSTTPQRRAVVRHRRHRPAAALDRAAHGRDAAHAQRHAARRSAPTTSTCGRRSPDDAPGVARRPPADPPASLDDIDRRSSPTSPMPTGLFDEPADDPSTSRSRPPRAGPHHHRHRPHRRSPRGRPMPQNRGRSAGSIPPRGGRPGARPARRRAVRGTQARRRPAAATCRRPSPSGWSSPPSFIGALSCSSRGPSLVIIVLVARPGRRRVLRQGPREGLPAGHRRRHRRLRRRRRSPRTGCGEQRAAAGDVPGVRRRLPSRFIGASGLESSPMPNMAITTLGVIWIGVLGSFGAAHPVGLSNVRRSVTPTVHQHSASAPTRCSCWPSASSPTTSAPCSSAARPARRRCAHGSARNKSVEGFIGGTVLTHRGDGRGRRRRQERPRGTAPAT